MASLGILDAVNGENQQAREYTLKSEFCTCLAVEGLELENTDEALATINDFADMFEGNKVPNPKAYPGFPDG